jgi:hypothetical protein
MKIYFHANNKATLKSLQECGVKNVLVSHKYSYASIGTFSDCFENIFVVAGSNDNPDKYHDFLKEKKEHYNYAAQYHVPNNMLKTIEYWKKESSKGLNTLPVLEEDFNKHLSQLNLPVGSRICIGKMKGRYDTEDSIKKLPTNNKYHGLGKGKYINKKTFDSVDTSLWISAAMSKKCDIWGDNSIIPMTFGVNYKAFEPVLKHYCVKNREYMDIVGINIHGVEVRHYYTMLKLPMVLYYMPLCKQLKCYSDNFIN